MRMRITGRAKGALILAFALWGVFACAGTSYAWWMETQLAGVRLGDSAFVLYEMPGYGNPDAIVVATSQSAAGPATSESFAGGTPAGLSGGEGPGGGGAGGAGGGGGAFGGPGGPFGGGGGGGGMGPGMGPMMGGGPAGRGAPAGRGGGGGGGATPGMASGFWGNSRPGTVNVQTGVAGAMTGMGMAGQMAGMGGPPMPPMGGFGGPAAGPGGFGGPSARPGIPGAGAAAGLGQAAGGVGGVPTGGPGSGVSSFPDWALAVWFDLRENEIEYFYIRDQVAVGFVINKLDGKIVAISVAGEKCDFARTAMWKPHEYIQLGDSFKQVHYRYGWPHDIETFDGSGDPTNAGLITGGTVQFSTVTQSFRRDCILWYHEVRGEKQCNIAFTLHNLRVTRIHIWIPEPL